MTPAGLDEGMHGKARRVKGCGGGRGNLTPMFAEPGSGKIEIMARRNELSSTYITHTRARLKPKKLNMAFIEGGGN